MRVSYDKLLFYESLDTTCSGFISRHQLLFYYNLTLSTDAPQGFRCLCAVILHGVLYILSPSVFFDSLLVSEFASTHH